MTVIVRSDFRIFLLPFSVAPGSACCRMRSKVTGRVETPDLRRVNWDLTGARPTDALALPASQRLSHYPVGDLWYDARVAIESASRPTVRSAVRSGRKPCGKPGPTYKGCGRARSPKGPPTTFPALRLPSSGATPNCRPDVPHVPCRCGNGCRSYPRRSQTSRIVLHPSGCGRSHRSDLRGLRRAKDRDDPAQYRNDAGGEIARGRGLSSRFPLTGSSHRTKPSRARR
jgi:hypothetical protein